MDLGAFLRPEARLNVLMTQEGDDDVPGRLIRRGERLSWLCAAPQPPGRRLSLTLGLPGFCLDQEGDLYPAGPKDSAAVVILAEVRGCRPWRKEYALRLSLLGRVI
jgi:hypothetical protein